MRRLPILGLLLFLAACMTASRIEPGVQQSVGDSYSINTGLNWSRIYGEPALWTIDGTSLGKLQTWAGVETGQPLLEMENRKPPVFRAELTVFEIAEMVADTIEVVTGGSDVRISGLQSKDFDKSPGIAFELAYVDQGLPMRGMAYGAVRNGKLDLLLFVAPEEYYFDHYRPEVGRIFNSVSTI